jgi:RNA polymerase sigma-70 factor (ECF subfamily)
MVLGLCRLLLRDPVEAEDAAQQTFLSAHRSIAGSGYPRDPPAWLAAIARNECRARIRLRMREPLALPELPADLPDPLARAIRNADLEALWTALAELPRRQRRAFLLRELGGLSYGELGAALGVSRPAVESLLFRARQRLRGVLAGTPAVLVPAAMRDRLAELLPSFEPGTATLVGRVATLPVAAKLATATVGVGLIASGAAELRSDPVRQSRGETVRPSSARVVKAAPRLLPVPVSVSAPRAVQHRDEPAGAVVEPQERIEPEHSARQIVESGREGPSAEVPEPVANAAENRGDAGDGSDAESSDSSQGGEGSGSGED